MHVLGHSSIFHFQVIFISHHRPKMKYFQKFRKNYKFQRISRRQQVYRAVKWISYNPVVFKLYSHVMTGNGLKKVSPIFAPIQQKLCFMVKLCIFLCMESTLCYNIRSKNRNDFIRLCNIETVQKEFDLYSNGGTSKAYESKFDATRVGNRIIIFWNTRQDQSRPFTTDFIPRISYKNKDIQ